MPSLSSSCVINTLPCVLVDIIMCNCIVTPCTCIVAAKQIEIALLYNIGEEEPGDVSVGGHG